MVETKWYSGKEMPPFWLKPIGWLPWMTLVLTAIFLAKLPWVGVLVLAGFGWYSFPQAALYWVLWTLGSVWWGAPWSYFEIVIVCVMLVGAAALPTFIVAALLRRFGYLVDMDVSVSAPSPVSGDG